MSCRSSTRSGSIPKADKKIIHIHRFPAEVDAHYSVDVGIIGDISDSLDSLAEALDDHVFDADPEIPGSGLLREEFERGQQDSRYPLAPQRLVADIREALGRSDVVLVDTGATKMWMARLYPTYEPQHLPRLKWPVHHELCATWSPWSQAGPSRVEGAGRGG